MSLQSSYLKTQHVQTPERLFQRASRTSKDGGEMDTSPVVVDSILQDLYLDFQGHSVLHLDRESPLPTIRPASHNSSKSRTIPIQFVRADKPAYSEESSIVLDEDGRSCLKGDLDPESPLAKKFGNKPTSAEKRRISSERLTSRSPFYRDRSIIIDDDDPCIPIDVDLSSCTDKHSDSRILKPSRSRATQPNKSDDLLILHSENTRRDLKNPTKSPFFHRPPSNTSTTSSGRRLRDIPVIVLDVADTKSERSDFKSLAEAQDSSRLFSDGQSTSSSTDKVKDSGHLICEVNCPPGYPVYDVLRDMLRSETRQIDYIQGDGNCFFRALSKQLYSVEKYHKSVRSLIIDLIATHKKEFAQFIDHEDVQSHVVSMSEDRSWATTCEVYAAATLLQRDLYMLTPSPGPQQYKWLYFKPVFSMEPQCSAGAGDGNGGCSSCYITLCNTNGNHYDRVVPTLGGCNCFLTYPQLDGAHHKVDLTL